MTVWYTISTIFNQRFALRFAGLLVLFVALTTTLFLSDVSTVSASTNRTIGFQGRLLRPGGSVVPDGHYNIRFTIYQDGSGSAAGNPDGTQVWTESHINNGNTGGISVRNGYFSVSLGSKTPFGSSVDWNHDALWISMNVAGTASDCTSFGSGACVADGEMLPMKQINAVPYALNSGTVGGKSADRLAQLGQGVQHDSSTTSSIFINKTTTAGNLIQLQNSLIDVFTVDNSGNIVFGGNADKSISVGTAAEDTAGKNLVVVAGSGGNGNGASGGTLVLSGGEAGGSDGNGGNITLSGGSGSGNGASGLVVLSTPTYSTITDDANCYTNSSAVAASCTVTAATVNNASAVLVGFTSDDQTATLPDPAITTPGRTFSVMAAPGSEDFELATNNGNDRILLTQNTTRTVIWNGSDWTATTSTAITESTIDGVERLKIGDNDTSNEPTLLTVDSADSAPASSGDALLGSMYYDTSLGKVQCYEAEGWGACGSSPDSFITLSPEYSNAVMNGTDIGTINSDLCSDTLNINDGSNAQPTICGTDETRNFYKWTSAESSAQTRSIYITHQLPDSFKEFIPESTSLLARTDSDDAAVTYQVYRDSKDNGLISCGGSPIVVSSGSQTVWQKAAASGGADPSTCGFEPGESILIRINLSAHDDASAYVSDLSFTFSNN